MNYNFPRFYIFAFFLVSISYAYEQKPGLFERAWCTLSELLAGRECCKSARVNFRLDEFLRIIQEKLHGQQVAAEMVANAVSSHWDPRHTPRKALVLTLHGPTGVGKTYITKILAEYTFAYGDKSQFYHFFSALIHFPHKEYLRSYREQIRNWVLGNVSYCEKSVFVFDEVDKMPLRLLDSLKPFLDYGSVINDIDFRRSIYILLSNIGSKFIVQNLAKWLRQGKPREHFTSKKMDFQLSEQTFTSDESSLKDSLLLQHHLISRFVPFLPLERKHVAQCIKEYLIEIHQNGLVNDKEFINSVLKEMPFVPKDEAFFSSLGCKRVHDKVDEALEAMSWKSRRGQRNEF